MNRHGMRWATQESTATAIYGIIVSSAVLAASHAESVGAVVAAVLVTLLIYWLAERYARLVAERIHAGRRPTWAQVRHQLTSGWEFVTASLLPLLALVVVSLTGADLPAAVLTGLGVSTLLLCLAGWEIGASGRLTLAERLMTTAVAGLFGAGMILLKALLH